MKQKLICIVGPTGAGKSAVAVSLAGELGGAIINADSRQVYKYMDIGTAKPTLEEMGSVPHYLMSIAEPHEVFSVGIYQEKAKAAISEIATQGKVPFLVGGSGQYIWSMVEGWDIPQVEPDNALRAELETLAESQEGREELLARLNKLDPATYERVDKNNMRRVVRAIEASINSDKPFSQLRRKGDGDYDVLMIGLTMERALLYDTVDKRVDKMIENGMLEETRHLLEIHPHKHSVLATIGYKQLLGYINNEMSLQEALSIIKFETHRYIRQQYTWFKPADERINWFTLDKSQNDQNTIAAIKDLIEKFLRGEVKGGKLNDTCYI